MITRGGSGSRDSSFLAEIQGVAPGSYGTHGLEAVLYHVAVQLHRLAVAADVQHEMTELLCLNHVPLPPPEASARAWLRRSSRATRRPASPRRRDAPSHAPSPRRRSAAGRMSSTRRRGPAPGGRLTPPRPRSPETPRGRRPSANP